MIIGAVITADIVNSTTLSPEQDQELTGSLNVEFRGRKFEFYRGDSFQAYIKDASEALRIVLKTRSIAKRISSESDVRASIGIGEVKTPIRSLKTANSEAFVLSGRAFDELAGSSRLNIRSSNDLANSSFRVIAYFCDYIFKQLTQKQAAVIYELLLGHTQIVAAKNLDITQATVHKHAQSASWPQIETVLEEYKQVVTQFKLL